MYRDGTTTPANEMGGQFFHLRDAWSLCNNDRVSEGVKELFIYNPKEDNSLDIVVTGKERTWCFISLR